MPLKFFNELDESCQNLVNESINDPEAQYLIGTYLIEGNRGFQRNIEYGVKYLERSNENGCPDSALYLCEMYQKGEIIPQDLKNAKECLYQNVNADE